VRVHLRRHLLLRLPLRRLILYITAFCVACGACVLYPELVSTVAGVALLIGPSLLICTLFSQHSPRPWLMLFVTMCGVLMGVFLSPGLWANLEPFARWSMGLHWHWNGFRPVSLFDMSIPPLCALVVGSAGWRVIRVANLGQNSDDHHGGTETTRRRHGEEGAQWD